MTRTTQLVLVLAVVAGCKGRNDDRASASQSSSARSTAPDDGDGKETGTAMVLEEGRFGTRDSPLADAKSRRLVGAKAAAPAPAASVSPLGGMADLAPGAPAEAAEAEPDGEAGPAAPTRAWFPETFLFEPLIVTDASGAATVPVRVPDRLTTWRVLALAHGRNGAQGGAVTSFLGTLPVYVDPIVPSSLVIGDEVRLPIQVVNTTDAAAAGRLEISAENATLTSAGGTRTVPARGSVVEYTTLRATQPGMIELRAGLVLAAPPGEQVASLGADAVKRSIEVLPAGKPMIVTRSGTLASARTLSIEGPVGSDPATDRVRLVVFPGALALLRSELGVSVTRTGVAEAAYALLLAGRAPALLQALGDQANPVALRDLTVLAGQRVVRDARTLEVERASLIAGAALAHPQNPVLVRLGERAAEFLARQQRPDGTFAGGTGWTLQRVLAVTAEATRAVQVATGTKAQQQRAQGVTMRAAGAFARNAEQVTDGYTAALMLASGAVEGALATTLRERVKAAIGDGGDGAKYLKVEPGVVRADGSEPSRVEATAVAVQALAGDVSAAATLADLGGTLLGGYGLARGWGDGRANLAAMQAVTQLFDDPLPATVTITLTRDGAPILSGTLDRTKLKDVLALRAAAPGLGGVHEWKVLAEPPVPGLGFALALEGWVPWATQAADAGLELALPAQLAGAVGTPIDVALTAIAPQGMPLHITQALPAGVQVDTPSLQKLVDDEVIERFETADGRVELFVSGLEPGAVLTASYRVIPTLAGTIHGAASRIESGPHVHHVPPTTWTIKP